MTKKFMMLIAAMLMTTLSAQANIEVEKSEFTVTQVALDAAAAKTAAEQTEEDTNDSTDKTKPEGGTTEEK
ncbi:hypothetical protein ACLHDG_10990 [Sulfurovum sp. CS9]|uniref:hypothetical protein n=1 Tax=Sulfurovum sp. CS9 TaxID=3391146 RepID=UPI0039EBA8BA